MDRAAGQNLTADLGLRMAPLRFLLRDRDGKYNHAFDTVFQADDLYVIKNAPRAPRTNAHCERATAPSDANSSTTS